MESMDNKKVYFILSPIDENKISFSLDKYEYSTLLSEYNKEKFAF